MSSSSRPIFLWYPPLHTPFLDDDLPTHTSREQQTVERRVEDSLLYVLPRRAQSKKKKQGAHKHTNTFGGDDDSSSSDDEIELDTEAPVLTCCPSLCQLGFESHAAYLLAGLMGQGCHSSLDASRPWLVYWCVHGLDVLDKLHDKVSDELAMAIVQFIARCVNSEGGVGGGPGQQAHTAPTYAAVLSLCILSSHKGCSAEAIALLRSSREGIYRFLMRCKVGHAASGFRVSRDGEVDTRGAYTVLTVASLLNLLTPELTAGVGRWLALCQTHEGGIGGEPGNEAHGGYTFCGLAASVLLNSTSLLHLPALLKWAAHRQMEREGGFQGRTNKLVDGCYSFWVGALFPLLYSLLQQPPTAPGKERTFTASPPPEAAAAAASAAAAFATTAAPAASSEAASSSSSSSTAAAAAAPSPSPSPSPLFSSDPASYGWLFDTLALQRYVLVSCSMTMGGLRDKPGKYADLYHTCYCLSGLSVAQNATSMENSPLLGQHENLLAPVHPVYNLRYAHVERIMQIFATEATPPQQ